MLKTKIADILDNYFTDEAMIAEINEVFKKAEDEVADILNSLSSFGTAAVSMLDTKPVTQAEIRDWATLNGYAMIKCTSIADRLKVEKVAREIWGDTIAGEDMYFIE